MLARARAWTHRRVADDEGRRRSHARSRRRASTSSISARANRTFRRRRTSRRRRTRHRRELHEVHDQLGHRRAEARDRRRATKTDYGVDYADQRGHRHRRRQAGALQRRDGALRRRRRGHHAHAGLADARRADQAGRRHAGHRPHPRRGRLPRCTPTRSSTRSRRARAASSSTRRAIRPGALMSEEDLEASPTKRARAGSGSCSICATRS